MTFKLGLTGSIGMGKSTTAQMFVEAGCALWDADAAVHRIYGKNGAAVARLAAVFPQAIQSGEVSRTALKAIIREDPSALQKIEDIVHPLVAADRNSFLADTKADITVLDIPLLFETGVDRQMDGIVCVTVSAEEQEKRVLARGTMSLADFERIRENQMPNAEKCARADYVIETDTIESARAQVLNVVAQIRRQTADA